MKTIAPSLALLLALGCASSPSSFSHETGGNAGAASVTTNPKNAPDYILLSAPSQVRTFDFGNAVGVRGLHVRGTMTNRGLIPAGEIQGNGKFCTDGKDWLSLSDLKVYTADQTPSAPYILGCATSSGFQPATRAIVAQ